MHEEVHEEEDKDDSRLRRARSPEEDAADVLMEIVLGSSPDREQNKPPTQQQQQQQNLQQNLQQHHHHHQQLLQVGVVRGRRELSPELEEKDRHQDVWPRNDLSVFAHARDDMARLVEWYSRPFPNLNPPTVSLTQSINPSATS